VLAGQAGTQQFAYTCGKAVQFLFPVCWVLLIQRQRLRLPATTSRGLALGLGMGVLVSGIMLVVYFGWLAHASYLTPTVAEVKRKLTGFGVSSPELMIAAGVFYALIHSLLEEYYWRWFVFGQLRLLIPLPAAIVVSSLGFMGHHVIVLALYLPWPWWALASACVAFGGGLWAWLYQRSGSLFGPWLSHMIVDAAIFSIGYHMAFVAK
jgi:hypothetical protein